MEGLSYNPGTLTNSNVGKDFMIPKLGNHVGEAIRMMIASGPNPRRKKKRERKSKKHN